MCTLFSLSGAKKFFFSKLPNSTFLFFPRLLSQLIEVDHLCSYLSFISIFCILFTHLHIYILTFTLFCIILYNLFVGLLLFIHKKTSNNFIHRHNLRLLLEIHMHASIISTYSLAFCLLFETLLHYLSCTHFLFCPLWSLLLFTLTLSYLCNTHYLQIVFIFDQPLPNFSSIDK